MSQLNPQDQAEFAPSRTELLANPSPKWARQAGSIGLFVEGTAQADVSCFLFKGKALSGTFVGL